MRVTDVLPCFAQDTPQKTNSSDLANLYFGGGGRARGGAHNRSADPFREVRHIC